MSQEQDLDHDFDDFKLTDPEIPGHKSGQGALGEEGNDAELAEKLRRLAAGSGSAGAVQAAGGGAARPPSGGMAALKKRASSEGGSGRG